MTAIATRCKKAGLLGLFLWLAVAGISSSKAQPSLLEQLEKGYPSLPASPQQPGDGGPSSRKKSAIPPLRLDIEKATALLDERTREPVVSIMLTARSGRMFGELTTDNVGRRTELRVDGKVVAAPIIREPIKGGSIQISGSMTLADAKELADRLNSGSAKVELEVVD
jgi:preprotein translocase subunit SecD